MITKGDWMRMQLCNCNYVIIILQYVIIDAPILLPLGRLYLLFIDKRNYDNVYKTIY